MKTGRQAGEKAGPVDLYELLGVSPLASHAGIRDAYHALARKYHPDATGAGPEHGKTERFKQISAAYAILRDPDRRQQYDAERLAESSVLGSAFDDIFAGGAGSAGPTIFGSKFDDFVAKVGREGVRPQNIDDLVNDFFHVAKDVQGHLPERVARSGRGGSSFFDWLERLAPHIEVATGPMGTGGAGKKNKGRR